MKRKATYTGVRLPLLLRAANWIGGTVCAIGRRPLVSLSPGSLWAAAERRSGLRLEEDPITEERLQLLVRSFEEEADLTTVGRYLTREVLVHALSNRLLIRHTLRQRPEILETRVDQPLFVVGFARTGTTLLHRLLALDDAVRAPAMWEVVHPVPPPMPAISPSDTRIAETMATARPFSRLLTHFARIHHFDPLSPEECSALRNNTLVHEGFLGTGYIPTYLQWLRGLDSPVIDEAFREYRSQVQLLAHYFPRRRWVSKNPFHCLHLDSLLRVFPNARIVRTLRDPAEAIASAASLFAVLHAYCSRTVRPRELGALVLEWYREALECHARTCRCAPAAEFIDVQYADLVKDPIGTVRSIYEKLGLELHPVYEAAMRQWLAENAQRKHGEHHYSLAEFGLSDADVARLR